MCKQVADIHTRARISKEHHVVSLVELAVNPRKAVVPLCPEHEEAFRYFDVACDKLICRDCQALEHNGHKCIAIAEAATNVRRTLDPLCAKATASAASVHAAQGAVGSLQAELAQALSEEKRKVRSAFSTVSGDLGHKRSNRSFCLIIAGVVSRNDRFSRTGVVIRIVAVSHSQSVCVGKAARATGCHTSATVESRPRP
jgi:hypothetical protein